MHAETDLNVTPKLVRQIFVEDGLDGIKPRTQGPGVTFRHYLPPEAKFLPWHEAVPAPV
jgi:hypothetical protein